MNDNNQLPDVTTIEPQYLTADAADAKYLTTDDVNAIANETGQYVREQDAALEAKLTAMIEAANKNTEAQMAMIASNNAMVHAINASIAQAQAPRMLILDADGRPIGVRLAKPGELQ